MESIFLVMMIVGLTLGFAILAMFIWGAKQGQFDDSQKIMGGLLFDSQEDLNDAIDRQEKRKKLDLDKHSSSLDKADS